MTGVSIPPVMSSCSISGDKGTGSLRMSQKSVATASTRPPVATNPNASEVRDNALELQCDIVVDVAILTAESECDALGATAVQNKRISQNGGGKIRSEQRDLQFSQFHWWRNHTMASGNSAAVRVKRLVNHMHPEIQSKIETRRRVFKWVSIQGSRK